MFDYVSGGSCACCGFQHLFLPNGVSDLVDAVSDLDTDQAGEALPRCYRGTSAGLFSPRIDVGAVLHGTEESYDPACPRSR